MPFFNKFYNLIQTKIFFISSLNKITNIKLKNYFIDFFSLKTILIKFLIFFIFGCVSSILFFSLRKFSLDNLYCVLNSGSAFGSLSDNQQLVYSLKSIFSVVFILLFIFFNRWYFCLSFYIIGWSSILNIIDKSIVDFYDNKFYYNSVVDYIHFTTFNFYNNVADILIFVGLFSLLFSFIYYMYKVFKNQYEDDVDQEIFDSKE